MSEETEIIKDWVTTRYPVLIYWDNDDGIWVAEYPDLKGCKCHGETQVQALYQLRAVKLDWIRSAIAEGWEKPTPTKSFQSKT